MVNTFIFRNVRIAALSMLLFVAFTATSQVKKAVAVTSNTYGISDVLWRTYENKTNLLLESIDEQSFINYVIFSNDGDFGDTDYFLDYIGGKIKKNKAELIYEIGTGKIKSIAEINAYFSSLQPAYANYFLEFRKRRDEIVADLDQRRAPGAGTFPTPLNCGSPCTNPGFESGTGFWDYYTGSACASSTSDPCSIVAGYSSTQHVIQTAGGFDPVVGAGLPLVPAGGGSSSLMLGDGPVTGGLASRASISFTVSAANANFTYRYACVLQDPVSGHTDPERPYFNVHLRDASGALITCGDYMVMAKPPIVGFTLAPGTTDVYYRPWTTVFVPLSSYIGQCVTIQFTSSDCSQGGHYGYAYIDGDCDPLTLLTSSPSVCGGSPVTLTAPAGGASYSWTNTAGGTTGIVGSTTGQTCSVNAGGTYQCVITSVAGPSCTTTLTITVGSSPTSPVASFTNTTVCAGTPTVFTDTSTPSSITGWAWDFDGDGITDSNLQNPSYTFPSAGTYSVTLIVTKGSCNATITLTVTVNPGTPPAITPAGPFCADAAAVNLVGTPAGGTWSGSGITNAATGTFTPSAATIGSNTVTYTTTGACGGTVNATIVVNALPVTTVNSPTSCPGATSTLTGAGATTYSWSTGSSANPITVSPVVTTSYTVTGTTSGCTSSAVATVTIGGSISPAVNSPAICAGATATLTAAGGTTYSWSNGSVVNPTTVTPTTTTSYTVTANTGGCTGTAVATVTVNPLPVLNITNPAAVCSPSTVDITAAAVTAGSTGGGTLSYWSDAAASLPLGSPSAIGTSGTYYIESTTAAGCTDIAPVVATINPLPVSNAGPDIAFCSGSTGNIGVAATAGDTYSWTATTGLSSSTVSNPTVTLTTGSAPATSIYTVTTTITATGCTSTDQVNVTVNPLPVLVITNPAAVCSPSTVDITAASVTAGSSISGSILSYWNDATATSPLAGPGAIATSGTYYIEANAGSCTDIQPVTVTINPLPVSNAGPDITICTGSTGNLGAAAVAGLTYSWSPATGLSSTTASNPTVTLINGGTASIVSAYTVITTNGATGCTSTDAVNVTVDAVATANAGSAQSVCIGSSITLAGAVGGSATGGTWSGGSGTFAPNNTTLNAVYTPSAAEYAAGSVTLTLTTNDPTGPCTFASSNVTFSFFPTPVVNFSTSSPSGCPVHCTNFTDLSTVSGGDIITGWLWDFGDGSPTTGMNITQNPSHCYQLTGFYNVTLTVTSNNGCTNTMTITNMIQVFAVPIAEFYPTPNPATILNPVVTLNNQSSSDVVSWYYSFGDGDTCAYVTPSPVHGYPNVVAGTYTATLTVMNSDGCIATVQHDIVIGPEFTFYIPNAFTPNGDGVNDFFFGQGIGIDKFDLYIFDRWGNEIFHGHDLSDMWNGKANGGSDVAQQDVYVWKVKLTDVFGKKHNYIGTVTLVK